MHVYPEVSIDEIALYLISRAAIYNAIDVFKTDHLMILELFRLCIYFLQEMQPLWPLPETSTRKPWSRSDRSPAPLQRKQITIHTAGFRIRIRFSNFSGSGFITTLIRIRILGKRVKKVLQKLFIRKKENMTAKKWKRQQWVWAFKMLYECILQCVHSNQVVVRLSWNQRSHSENRKFS